MRAATIAASALPTLKRPGAGGKTLAEDLAENIDVVDSLAGKNAFTEQILVHVGNRASVNIQSGLAGINISESRAVGGVHADADTRLQNAITLLDGVGRRINLRAIQRMGSGANQAMRAITRQLGVGIEGDHISNASQDGKVADLHGEFVGIAAQQFVEVQEFAALALPTHPGVFHLVKNAVAVEMVERPHSGIGVLAIQALNQLRAQRNVGVLFVKALAGIGRIGEQSEK